MYVFLLALGAVAAAAGLVLVASGVSIQEHAFDPTNITAGTIAAIGGCILIGLAFVVRALLRVERALNGRPVRPGEAAIAVAPNAAETARIPFPPKPKPAPNPQPATAAVAAPAEPAADAALERLREKFPNLERLETAPVVEESDVSLLPKAPAPSDEDAGEVKNGQVSGATNVAAHGNGAAPAKTMQRVEAKALPAGKPERPKGSIFDSLWPKTQRLAPAAAAAPVVQPAPTALPARSMNGSEPAPNAQPAIVHQDAPAPVSILKSGVVEGMAYTLYSDGSIEAQLPQGMLRFGSITELRNHIEQNS